ncbi:MAG TPA: CDP-alcohol phosphatidyltransferase family protein [Kofleriaceae bacterium]|nr:CDP-alcohol phosphatidyltransferase family protein [Kofleriaceae bacterium]
MLWIAHALTLSRIPLGMALVYAYGDPLLAVTLIAIAALTDTLDGNVARALQRRGHTEPAIGGWLDPLIDKVFIAIVLSVLWYHTRDVVVIALIGARELFVLPLAAYYAAKHRPVRELRADGYGKLATVAQFIGVAIVIGYPPLALPAAAVTATLGVITGVHYVAREITR